MKISKQIRQVVKQITDHPLQVGSLGQVGEQVIYIPSHLFGEHQNPENWHYPNGIQPGFIYTVPSHRKAYGIRYFQWNGGVCLPYLRTLANSEMTPGWALFYFKFFTDDIIQKAIDEIRNTEVR